MYLKISLVIATYFIVPLRGLLYSPRATSLALTYSVSYPIPEYFPERAIIIDWCFAMGYSVPGTVSAFYNIPIWPVKGRPQSLKRDISTALENPRPAHYAWYKKYGRKLQGRHHFMDLTAGELYRGIEDYFGSFGFHETCLLRSVCDLAQHPFDDKHSNILTEVLTFILSPSLHQGFEQGEEIYRKTYEAAEMNGFLGKNCSLVYPNCKRDILSILTKIAFIEK